MAKKRSLGHNPLAYSMRGSSSFEFIRSTDGESNGVEEGSVTKRRTPKKVVSYYLDEEIIEGVKALAAEHGRSCSGLLNDYLSGKFGGESESQDNASKNSGL